MVDNPIKDDKSKLRLDLIDPKFEEELARVLGFGAAKYSENNWQNLEDGINRHYAALQRHLNAWRQGKKIDSESHLPHLWHAAANIMFLCFHERNAASKSPEQEENVHFNPKGTFKDEAWKDEEWKEEAWRYFLNTAQSHLKKAHPELFENSDDAKMAFSIKDVIKLLAADEKVKIPFSVLFEEFKLEDLEAIEALTSRLRAAHPGCKHNCSKCEHKGKK